MAEVSESLHLSGNTSGQYRGVQKGRYFLLNKFLVQKLFISKAYLHSSLQYQLDADTLSESLSKLGSTVDAKTVNGKTSTEIQMQLQVKSLFKDFTTY